MPDKNISCREKCALEEKRKKIIFYVSSSLVLVLVTLIISVFSGALGFAGFKNREGGIYTDCSLRENMGIRYCRGADAKADEAWKNLKINKGKGSAFSLN